MAETETETLSVLFVMVDDLNLGLGCYGHPAVKTPHIDALAARGVRFTEAFCPYPLCGPSRSSLLTGRRPESLGMDHNEFAWRDALPDLQTLPQLARRAGWHTRRIGKIAHHGIPGNQAMDHDAGFQKPHTYDDPPSWDHEWGDAPRLDEINAKGHEQVFHGQPHGGRALHTCEVDNEAVLPDRLIADRAVRFLADDATRDRPFFLAVGFHKPHVPLFAPRRWWRAYDGLEVDPLLSPTAREPHQHLPPRVLLSRKWHRGMTPEQRCYVYRGYLAATSFMDEQFGRVLHALDANGHAPHTLIVFVSDHGYHVGEHGQWNKQMLLDPSLRVPLILSGPRVPAGETRDGVCESLDLFPTVAKRLGLPADQSSTQAHDLWPRIIEEADEPAGHAFAWIRRGEVQGWTVRDQRYRLGVQCIGDAPPTAYLFDYQNDPYEQANLADRASRRPILGALYQTLAVRFADTSPLPALASAPPGE